MEHETLKKKMLQAFELFYKTKLTKKNQIYILV